MEGNVAWEGRWAFRSQNSCFSIGMAHCRHLINMMGDNELYLLQAYPVIQQGICHYTLSTLKHKVTKCVSVRCNANLCLNAVRAQSNLAHTTQHLVCGWKKGCLCSECIFKFEDLFWLSSYVLGICKDIPCKVIVRSPFSHIVAESLKAMSLSSWHESSITIHDITFPNAYYVLWSDWV